MNILIAYYSQTGNTTEVARAICDEVSSQGHQVHLKTVAETKSDDLNAYDLVFLGSACHDAGLAKPVERLLQEIDKSPSLKLAGFVTHATQMAEEGARARELYERWAGNCLRTFHQVSEEKQIAFLGYFHCQGIPSPPIEAFIHNTIVTDKAEWELYIEEVKKHPTGKDMQDARAFAQHMLTKC
jgi:flavodoxin